MEKSRVVRAAVALAAVSFMPLAFAHPGMHHAAASFSAGFSHPLFGWDHLLALLAIGLWAAQQERNAVRTLLLAFPLAMAAGAFAALRGIALPLTEPGVATSVALAGLLVAFAVRMPKAASLATATVFALLHGYVHGMEMPSGGEPVLYVLGFVAATALVQLAALAIGSKAQCAMRAIGAGVAVAGVLMLAGAV